MGQSSPRTARARRPDRFSHDFSSFCWTAARHAQLRSRAFATALRSVFRRRSCRTAGGANLDFCAPCAGFTRFYEDRRSASRLHARAARTRKSNVGRVKNTSIRYKNCSAARSSQNLQKTSVWARKSRSGTSRERPGRAKSRSRAQVRAEKRVRAREVKRFF